MPLVPRPSKSARGGIRLRSIPPGVSLTHLVQHALVWSRSHRRGRLDPGSLPRGARRIDPSDRRLRPRVFHVRRGDGFVPAGAGRGGGGPPPPEAPLIHTRRAGGSPPSCAPVFGEPQRPG